MKSTFVFQVLLMLLCSVSAIAQCKVLVWSDEFDQDGLLNTAKWQYQTGGGGWGNNELQYYTSARSENARVENGHLTIEARKEAFQGSQYTSARINSKFSITYGRVEMKAKLPHGRGTWAAMWMYPTGSGYGNGGWPDNGEIDIMEYVGHDSNVVHASAHSHTFNWKNNNVKTNWQKVSGLEHDFHIYALEWDSTKMDYYVDDIKYLSVTNDGSGWQGWPYNKDYHLILNLAIGGSWGGEKGVDASVFPTQYQIDYVRMYSSPGTYAPLTGPAKVFTDSVYRYEVSQNANDVYTWQVPSDAAVQGKNDSNVVFVKWGATDGKVISRVTKNCGYWSDSLSVFVYDTIQQRPFGGRAWPIPGRIEAENFDVGGKGRAYQDFSQGNAGTSTYRDGEDVDMEKCADSDSTQNVGWIADGEWLEYTVNVDSAANYNLKFRIASISVGAVLHVEMNGVDVSGSIVLPSTSGWQAWQTYKVFYKALVKGKQFMRIIVDRGGFNFNYLDVSVGTLNDLNTVALEGSVFSLRPNPTKDLVYLTFSPLRNEDAHVRVLNVLGQQVLQQHILSSDVNVPAGIDLSVFSPGFYFVTVTQREHVLSAKVCRD